MPTLLSVYPWVHLSNTHSLARPDNKACLPLNCPTPPKRQHEELFPELKELSERWPFTGTCGPGLNGVPGEGRVGPSGTFIESLGFQGSLSVLFPRHAAKVRVSIILVPLERTKVSEGSRLQPVHRKYFRLNRVSR